MAIEFIDIEKNLKNGDNMGGITQKIWFGLHKDVETWPTKPLSTTTDLETNGKLTGSVVMKAGKRMFGLYVTDDKGSLKYNLVGPKDGKSGKWTLKIFHPGLQAKILGFVNAAKNEDLVIIVPDNDGDLFLLGDEDRAVSIETGEGGQGETSESEKGNTLEFTYKTSKLLIYTGTIPKTILGSGSGG